MRLLKEVFSDLKDDVDVTPPTLFAAGLVQFVDGTLDIEER